MLKPKTNVLKLRLNCQDASKMAIGLLKTKLVGDVINSKCVTSQQR